jgi:hypothetical protein
VTSRNTSLGTLAGSNHRHGRKRGQQADHFPTAEMFLQHETSEDHSHGRIQRTDDNGFIEPSVAAGVDKQRAGADVEDARHHAQGSARAIECERGAGYDDRGGGKSKGSDAGDGGDPRRRSAAGLVDAEIESGKAYAGERCQANASRTTSWRGLKFFLRNLLRNLEQWRLWLLGSRNQPYGENGKGETREGPATGRAFHGDVGERRDGCAEQGGDRSSESHLSGGEGAVEEGERESTERAGGQRPEDTGACGKGGVLGQGNRQHEDEGADMRESCEDKGVGPAGAVSSGEIGGAPDQHSCSAVDRGRELSEGMHDGRG